MRAASGPRLHVFVCANRREGSPLGPGCAERGDALYSALKDEVAARRKFAEIWITKTHCLGICPKQGATVARYAGASGAILEGVEVADIARVLEPPEAPDPWLAVERELVALEELQTTKVLDLARRLSPGLTLEDIRNPHDFPDLDDPDWHYADGVLTGIKSVTSALRALRSGSGSG